MNEVCPIGCGAGRVGDHGAVGHRHRRQVFARPVGVGELVVFDVAGGLGCGEQVGKRLALREGVGLVHEDVRTGIAEAVHDGEGNGRLLDGLRRAGTTRLPRFFCPGCVGVSPMQRTSAVSSAIAFCASVAGICAVVAFTVFLLLSFSRVRFLHADARDWARARAEDRQRRYAAGNNPAGLLSYAIKPQSRARSRRDAAYACTLPGRCSGWAAASLSHHSGGSVRDLHPASPVQDVFFLRATV